MRVSQTTGPLWQSRAGDSPAGFAALYRDAAQRIRASGYDAATVTGDYEGSHGISITTALRLAAETYGAHTRGEGIFGPTPRPTPPTSRRSWRPGSPPCCT